MDYNDKVLYGKSNIKNIVSLEVKDDVCELFIQQEDGSVNSQFEKNKFWILSNRPHGNSWVRLKGDQYYKYGRQFENREDFLKFKYRNKDKDLYSISDPREAIMIKNGYTYFKGLNYKDISVLSFDIETTGLNPQAEDALLILISTTYRDKNGIKKKLFSYDEYESEGEMIAAFSDYVIDLDPTILLGHNLISFDLPYIIERSKQNNYNLILGRDGSEPEVFNYESKFRLDGTRDLHYKRIRIYGREIIDTMFLAYNMDVARSYESYGLKQIIKQEKLEKENRVFYDASKIRDNYKDPVEFQKIKEYCVDDSDDALNLFDKLIPVYFNMCRMIPKTFQAINESASGSKLNSLMVRAYLQDGHSVAKANEVKRIDGALSFGIPGIYQNIIKLDFSSLYPSIILQYKVSNKEKDPNGYLYYITKTMREMRLEYKKKYKETGDEQFNFMDSAAKSVLNSLYGFLCAPGLNYNCTKSGEFITSKGREFLKQAIEYVTDDSYTNFYEQNKDYIIHDF